MSSIRTTQPLENILTDAIYCHNLCSKIEIPINVIVFNILGKQYISARRMRRSASKQRLTIFKPLGMYMPRTKKTSAVKPPDNMIEKLHHIPGKYLIVPINNHMPKLQVTYECT